MKEPTLFDGNGVKNGIKKLKFSKFHPFIINNTI